jgi:hypothetical protein
MGPPYTFAALIINAQKMKLVNRTHRFLALFVGLAMLVPLFTSSFTAFKGKQPMDTENKKNEMTMSRFALSLRERSESLIRQFKITKEMKVQDSVTIKETDGSNLIDLQDGSFDRAAPAGGHQ